MYDDESDEARAFRDLHAQPTRLTYLLAYLIAVGVGAHLALVFLLAFFIF